jgi:hypothetical protein
MYLRFGEVLSPQITKKQKRAGPRIANPERATFTKGTRLFTNLTYYLSQQIFGFAIFGTYFRTAHLW